MAIFLDFCLSQPNVLNADYKQHAYIYVNNHHLSAVCVYLSFTS